MLLMVAALTANAQSTPAQASETATFQAENMDTAISEQTKLTNMEEVQATAVCIS